MPASIACRVLTILGVVLSASLAVAAQSPVAGKNDPRIRYVTYNKDDVTIITVQRGTVTRIILGEGEKILRDSSATGFSADCTRPESEWCMRADVGTNQILVKPKDGATHNNLELRTDRHDYSIAFQVLPDTPHALGRQTGNGTSTPMYRVMFRYPGEGSEQSSANVLDERLASQSPKPRNWKYTMQPRKGSADIIPSLVFDDGRFTYFQFPANREIPAIFYVSPSGEEARVNFHIDPKDDSLLVVERTGRRFVLRLGNAAVGIWNENFDAYGVPPKGGTTVDGVTRVLRQGDKHGR